MVNKPQLTSEISHKIKFFLAYVLRAAIKDHPTDELTRLRYLDYTCAAVSPGSGGAWVRMRLVTTKST